MFKAITFDSKSSMVSLLDPAIDEDASDLDAYTKIVAKNPTKAWRDHLKPKGGEKLTVFYFGVLDPSEFTAAEAASRTPEELYWHCFLLGLRGIDNWPVDQDKEIPTIMRNKVPFVDPVWTRQTFLRGLRQVGVGVGHMIYAYNQLTEDDLGK